MLPSIHRITLLLVSFHFLIACEPQSTPKVDAIPTATEPQTPPTQPDAPKPAAPKPAAPKPVEINPIKAKAEDTKPADKVHAIPFDQSKFPAEIPAGDILGGFAFTDAAGENHVVFTRTEIGTEDHIHTSVLRIKHVLQKPDKTTAELRSYTERIDKCDFDIILEPKFGQWSISDVDNNGIGEASFAYTADCVSDVSPLTHKAFVTQAGQKYTLRGRTYLQFPDEKPEGGEFTAEKMPPAFLTKAKQVWELTARR